MMNELYKALADRLVLLTILAGASGCTSQQFYAGGQAWQRNECQRIQDFQERKRCLESTALSYDEYQKQAASAKSPQ
jgi:hypothetical protein